MSRFNAFIKNKDENVRLSANESGMTVQIDGNKIGVLLKVEKLNNGNDIIKIYKTDGEINHQQQDSEIDPILIIRGRK